MNGEKGGPRTTHKDNSHPSIKLALRKWAVSNLKVESVLDVYGGMGMMYKNLWKNYTYAHSEGDAIQWLSSRDNLDYDCFDIDPYSSPYEALEIVCNKTNKNNIGVICTDGMLRRQAGMRGNLTKFIQDKCGWPAKDNTLMAGIYHKYPNHLRYVISQVCPLFKIDKLAIKYGLKRSQSTVYWAAILSRK